MLLRKASTGSPLSSEDAKHLVIFLLLVATDTQFLEKKLDTN